MLGHIYTLLLVGSGSVAPVVTAAGRGSKRAIEQNGRVILFESDEELSAYLEQQLPKEEKRVQRVARRLIKRAENALAPEFVPPIRVIREDGETEAEAVAAYLRRLESVFISEFKRKAQADEEAAIVQALILLME